jgi:hypothetical protein
MPRILLWFLFVLLFSENLVVVHNRPGWIDGNRFLQSLGHAQAVGLRCRFEVAVDAIAQVIIDVIQRIGRNFLDLDWFLLVAASGATGVEMPTVVLRYPDRRQSQSD